LTHLTFGRRRALDEALEELNLQQVNYSNVKWVHT